MVPGPCPGSQLHRGQSGIPFTVCQRNHCLTNPETGLRLVSSGCFSQGFASVSLAEPPAWSWSLLLPLPPLTNFCLELCWGWRLFSVSPVPLSTLSWCSAAPFAHFWSMSSCPLFGGFYFPSADLSLLSGGSKGTSSLPSYPGFWWLWTLVKITACPVVTVASVLLFIYFRLRIAGGSILYFGLAFL